MKRLIGLFGLYLVYFTDTIAWSIVLVIFGPMIVSNTAQFLPAEMTLATRNIIYGLLIGAYPLAQFFGAPILGELSDRFGRKPILLFSTATDVIALAISAVAIYMGSLWLLFVGRIVGGLTAGNGPLAQAAIVDLVPTKKRGAYLSFLVTLSGIAFIAGPFIGGVLASWFSFAAPFWFAAALFLFCVIFIWLGLEETHKVRADHSLHPIKVFTRLLEIFQFRRILTLLLSYSFIAFGWSMFILYLSAYLVERFKLAQIEISYAYVYIAICYVVAGQLSSLWLLRKFHSSVIAIIPLFAAAIFTVLIPTSSHVWWEFIGTAFSIALVTACLFTLFSHLAPEKARGRIFGSLAAVRTLSFAIPPLIVGFLANISPSLPIYVSSAFMLAGAIVFLIWFLSDRQNRTI